MRCKFSLCGLLFCGCGAIVEPGHRGLLFDTRSGLGREVLGPGRHWTGVHGRVDDFDVTYSTRQEQIETSSSEGLALGLKIEVIFRPNVSELYELDTDIGPNYYEEVIGPEFRSAARGVFALHSYLELLRKNESIENEIEDALRRRTAGKHVEIASVTLEEIHYAPEIATAVREKLVAEQDGARQKAVLENDALRKKLEIENQAEQDRLRAEAAVLEKQRERRVAEEQALLERVKAKTEAEIRVTNAKAEMEERTLLAKAKTEEQKALYLALTPLAVMWHGYDALEKLGGTGTQIYLGDFSRAPNFLFPRISGMEKLVPPAKGQ